MGFGYFAFMHCFGIIDAMTDTGHFKKKLEEELGVLTKQLLRIGRRNPSNPLDWEPIPEKMDILESDRNEAADRIEAYEENTAILKELEIRYNNVKLALEKIEDNTYGICEVGEEEIEKERLEANPAARTCTVHINDPVE